MAGARTTVQCRLCSSRNTKGIFRTSGFWPRVRARALRAPVFLSSLPRKQGAARPPPPNAASLLLIRPPEIYKIYRTWAAHIKGFFLSIGPHAD
jgi:hypothetical protein